MSYDTERVKVGREPVKVCSIYADFCQNTYGILPCTANGAVGTECYNTRKTCQDPANYNARGDVELLFTRASQAVGKDYVNHLDNIPRLERLYTDQNAWAALPNPPDVTDNTQITYAEMETQLRDWHANYPADISVEVFGTSVNGQNIGSVRLWDTDNKPIVGINLGIHGDETMSARGWIAGIQWLLDNQDDPLVISIKASVAIYFIPVLNPDGMTAGPATRDNANGVNLNRNWPYFWAEFDAVAAGDNKGTAPLSEPETLAATIAMAGRVGRVLMWFDVHDWVSKTTWGFLTEQIWRDKDAIHLQRAGLHHINAMVESGTYTPVNTPVKFTEYRSKRKPYLYTWMVNAAAMAVGGRTDTWGGILEMPKAESFATTATVAQRTLIGMLKAAVDHLGVTQEAAIVSETKIPPVPLNTNPHFQNWHSFEPRPQWFQPRGLRATQIIDPDLGELCELQRPGDFVLAQPSSHAAYTSWLDANGFSQLAFVGGNTGGTYLGDSYRVDHSGGAQSGFLQTLPVLPRRLQYGSLAYDSVANKIYFSGGWGVITEPNIFGYNDTVYSLDLTNPTAWVVEFVHANAARQRHTSFVWVNLGKTYLMLIGGRTAVGYIAEARAFDLALPAAGVLAGNLSVARGFHKSIITAAGVIYSFGGGAGAAPPNAALVTVDKFTPNVSVPPTALAATSLPLTRREMALGFDAATGIAYLQGGADGSNVGQSQLYEYATATDTVTAIAVTLATWTDDETGLLMTLEAPVLEDSIAFYNPMDQVFVVAGGRDELAVDRDEAYIFDYNKTPVFVTRAKHDTIAYGYMRMNQVFAGVAGDKFKLVATVKTLDVVDGLTNPYIRLAIFTGPLSAIQRKIRSWYMVPNDTEFHTIVMNFELAAGETEFRCYLRQYTSDTICQVATMQILPGREPYTYPLPVTLIKNPELLSVDLGALSTNKQFEMEGAFVPLFGPNMTVAKSPLISIETLTPGSGIELSYSEIYDSVNNEANTALLWMDSNLDGGYSNSVAAFEANYNRSSGKELRWDVIQWKLTTKETGLKFKLWFYGKEIAWTIPVSTVHTFKIIYGRNGIYSLPQLETRTPYRFVEDIAVSLADIEQDVGTSAISEVFETSNSLGEQFNCSLETLNSAGTAFLVTGDVMNSAVVVFACSTTVQTGLQLQAPMIPSLKSVSLAPTKIEPGKGIGRRASITVSIKDHPHHDRGVDPYVATRNYTPEDQGTFWGKWLARNPYYQNRLLTINSGYFGNSWDWANFQDRSYFINKIEGPERGEIRITALDILTLAGDKKSVLPNPTKGEISDALGITAMSTTLTLEPVGIGDLEYPLAGWVCVNDEVIAFNRVADLLTLTTRGDRGTTAAAHSLGDGVQNAIAFDKINVVDIIRIGLSLFAGIDEKFIPWNEWKVERDKWLSQFLLTATICEPTGVAKLLTELTEQFMFHIWWDERTQKIKLKATAPPSSEITLTDDANFIAESVHVKDDPNQRISQVWFSYGQSDPTDDKSYKKTYVQADLNAEGGDEYDERKIHKIKSRWLTSNDLAVVVLIASRKLSYLRDNPQVFKFNLDPKDAHIWTGDVVNIKTEHKQAFDGSALSTPALILSVAEKDGRLDYIAQNVARSGRYFVIAPDGLPDYAAATQAQKDLYGWIAPASGTFADGNSAYQIL